MQFAVLQSTLGSQKKRNSSEKHKKTINSQYFLRITQRF
jgi:hypothetical protein